MVRTERALRIRLGPSEFERQLVTQLRDGDDLSALAHAYGDGSVDRAVRALEERGIVGPIPAAVQVACLGSHLGVAGLRDARVLASPDEVAAEKLLVVEGALSDERIGLYLERARALRTPSLLAWTSRSTSALAWDDGVSRPCVRCALLFDREAWYAAPDGRAPADAAFVEADGARVRGLSVALIARVLDSGAERPTPGRALVVDTRSWRMTWEEYAAHPSCACAEAPAAVSDAPNRIASDWEATRPRRFAPLLCVEEASSSRPARALFRRARSPWPVQADAFGVATALGERAHLRCFAEGVERFAMLHAPADRRATPAGALHEPMLDDADVEALLFRDEERRAEGFRLSGFDRHAAQDWSWIEHVRSGRRLLAPASLVGRPADGSPRLVDATSNGYAAHRQRARAIELALLEIIERDAVLATWYFALEVPIVAPVADPRVADLDVEVTAILATQDVDLPVVWLLARLPDGALRSASAAALSFRAAWDAAIRELRAAVVTSRVGASSASATESPDLADASRRHGPEDHLRWYHNTEHAAAAIAALRASGSLSPDALERRWPEHGEAGGAAAILDALEAAELSAYLADRSLPEVFGPDWHVVRALVPGAIELSWGHAYRRIASPRAARMLAGRAPNPWPHPIA